jgi:hypothetical protein
MFPRYLILLSPQHKVGPKYVNVSVLWRSLPKSSLEVAPKCPLEVPTKVSSGGRYKSVLWRSLQKCPLEVATKVSSGGPCQSALPIIQKRGFLRNYS